MNKQQLATRIWASANKMRNSKIESGEYKDFVLGFIFYKYLSDREEKYLRDNGWDDDSLKEVDESDEEVVKYLQDNIGYFIGYNNLFSTWLSRGRDFGVKEVAEALSAFNRLISPTHKKVFVNIFFTLQTILTKLGDTDASRSSAISKLLKLIKGIPTTGEQGYDVLGYIYEYLIGEFAANAGKKAGEFYTPHEVSQLMAEIVAHNLKDREHIDIYDPTSGSGSLLITIGQAVAKYNDNRDAIKYYAQELIPSTYNLTRMNLVMRGIKPNNIITRNGDTLEPGCDWPYFETEEDRESTYHVVRMDAVVSNPPYSQEWDRPTDKEVDKRFKDYGLAPKKPADYAFLLHELYHLKNDGVMTIVLPHGVLFRPGDEAEIRKNLIEGGHIETIIGLPADIFFGTPIATIIMVVRRERTSRDVLFIDASKYASKSGKKKKLLASDIQRILETVVSRPAEVEKFARLVNIEEIRNNGYDLNIPKYVDSSEPLEQWNLYSSRLGGIPQKEISLLHRYWDVMPTLKSDLFPEGEYVDCKVIDLQSTIANHPDIEQFNLQYQEAFSDYGDFLKNQLIDSLDDVHTSREMVVLSDDLYRRLQELPLLDRYACFQSLNDTWEAVSPDIDLIQTEGRDVIRQIEENMVLDTSGEEAVELQKGWKGRIMPFDLVQKTLLPDTVEKLQTLQNRIAEISTELSSIVEEATEEDEAFLNEDKDSIDAKRLDGVVKDVLASVSTPEIETLKSYSEQKGKKDKLAFIYSHHEIQWSEMTPAKDGTYAKKDVINRILTLQSMNEFPENTFEERVVRSSRLIAEQKRTKSDVKELTFELEQKTIWCIESLTDEQIVTLLYLKWVQPIIAAIDEQRVKVISDLSAAVTTLVNKYATTLNDIEEQISETERELSEMLSHLTGNESDMMAIASLQTLLNHGK